MTEALKICYDRILPKDLARPMRTTGSAGRVHAIFPDIRKLWITGSTLRVRFIGGTAEQQDVARHQAGWWTQHANLKFEFNNAPDAEIRIAFDPNDGAWSYIGTDARSIPQDQPTMNLGFLDGGTAAHEFGHAIGLGHEHQNPEGGIQWNEAVVIRDLGGPPNFWTPEQVSHNVLEKYKVNQYTHLDKYDEASIMLYAFPGSWTKSGQGTKSNKVLSAADKAFIAGEKAYPRKSVDAVQLGVNAAPTQGKIGEPGEEDIYHFAVTESGRHIVQTGGQTDVVMKLFGPGSQTNLIGEDDDSGVGLNAKIVTELIPGQYFIQIRHYNQTRGTGAYSIEVKK